MDLSLKKKNKNNKTKQRERDGSLQRFCCAGDKKWEVYVTAGNAEVHVNIEGKVQAKKKLPQKAVKSPPVEIIRNKL